MVSQQQIMQLLQNPQVQQMVQGLLSQVTGGKGKAPDLSQLLHQLNGGGLSGQAQSWIGTGDNEPITGEQLQQALGDSTVSKVAEEAGVAPEVAANELANVIPELVDSLSPHGELPDSQALQSQLSKLLATPRS